MPVRRAATSLILVASLVAASAPARIAFAAPTEAESARAAELKSNADAAMVSLRYQDTLDGYNEAAKLVDDPAFYYKRGRALQGLGLFPEALEQLEAFEVKAPPELKA